MDGSLDGTALNWLRPEGRRKRRGRGARWGKEGGGGEKRSKGGKGGEEEDKGEGGGREKVKGALLGATFQPAGTKAPALSVPGKVCLVPLPLEHQRWVPSQCLRSVL